MYQGYEQLPAEGDEPSRRRQDPVIRSAHPADCQRVTATIVAGCGETPLGQWLAPKTRFRQGVLTGYFRILATHLLTHGRVELIDGRHMPLAVAGWLPATAPAAPADYAEQVAQATAPWTDRFQALDDAVARAKAHGHRRLAFLAVLPTSQNQGLGSALLAHHLRELNEHGVSASAEAVDLRGARLLSRHGFAQHGQPLALAVAARDHLVLIPMRRPPDPPVENITVPA